MQNTQVEEYFQSFLLYYYYWSYECVQARRRSCSNMINLENNIWFIVCTDLNFDSVCLSLPFFEPMSRAQPHHSSSGSPQMLYYKIQFPGPQLSYALFVRTDRTGFNAYHVWPVKGPIDQPLLLFDIFHCVQSTNRTDLSPSDCTTQLSFLLLNHIWLVRQVTM